MMTWLPAAIQLGPLTLPIDRVSLLLGVWLGLYVMQKLLTHAGYQGKAITNVVFESLVLGFFAALLSPLLFHLQEVISHPLTALFGGIAPSGVVSGSVVFLIALWWKVQAVRPLPPWRALLDATVVALMVGWTLHSLAVEEYGVKSTFRLVAGDSATWYHPIFLYRALLLVIGIAFVIRVVRKSRVGRGGAVGLVWIGWIQLLLSWFESGSLFLLHLTLMQGSGLLLAIIGIALHRLTHDRSSSEGV